MQSEVERFQKEIKDLTKKIKDLDDKNQELEIENKELSSKKSRFGDIRKTTDSTKLQNKVRKLNMETIVLGSSSREKFWLLSNYSRLLI